MALITAGAALTLHHLSERAPPGKPSEIPAGVDILIIRDRKVPRGHFVTGPFDIDEDKLFTTTEPFSAASRTWVPTHIPCRSVRLSGVIALSKNQCSRRSTGRGLPDSWARAAPARSVAAGLSASFFRGR